MALESAAQVKACISSSPLVTGNASPPSVDITWTCVGGSSAGGASLFSEDCLRSEKNAIHFPSGDQSASLSWPERVNWTKVPPSRHSHRSRRLTSCSQSARVVPINTDRPSGEMFTSVMLVPLKNSSKLMRGLGADWAKVDVSSASRTKIEWVRILML